MGGPSPPTDLGELQLASRNMELEHCKNSKLISNIKEDTQEIPWSPLVNEGNSGNSEWDGLKQELAAIRRSLDHWDGQSGYPAPIICSRCETPDQISRICPTHNTGWGWPRGIQCLHSRRSPLEELLWSWTLMPIQRIPSPTPLSFLQLHWATRSSNPSGQLFYRGRVGSVAPNASGVCPKLTRGNENVRSSHNISTTSAKQKWPFLAIAFLHKDTPAHTCLALLDSSTEVSVLAHSVLEFINPTPPPFCPNPLTAASSHSLDVLGSVPLTFQLQGKEITHSFIVVKQLTSPCVLEIDFLTRRGIINSWKKKNELQTQNPYMKVPVYARGSIVVLPQTEKWCKAILVESIARNWNWMLEPSPVSPVMGSLISPEGKNLYVVASNPDLWHIDQGQSLGLLQQCHILNPDSINPGPLDTTCMTLTQLIVEESVRESIFKQKKAALCHFKVEQNISTLSIALELTLQVIHWFYFTFHLCNQVLWRLHSRWPFHPHCYPSLSASPWGCTLIILFSWASVGCCSWMWTAWKSFFLLSPFVVDAQSNSIMLKLVQIVMVCWHSHVEVAYVLVRLAQAKGKESVWYLLSCQVKAVCFEFPKMLPWPWLL